MGLARSLGSVGGLTLVSRVIALGRDTLQATYMGASFASDAFFVAFRLPNMFRALFAEGAFNAAFIPMFNRKVSESGELAIGIRFAEQALAILFPVLVLFTLGMIVAAWPITMLLSGGFHSQHPTHVQLAFAVLLSRITIPYLMLISLASLLGGILNSLDKYWVNAAAPILLNVSMVSALLFFHGADPLVSAWVQAISVTVGGALQLGWLMLACRQAGVSMRLRRPRLDDDVRRLMKLILPAAVGAGASQINLLISTSLAGFVLVAGSISSINFADRLNQLPLGLIGIGLGTVLLPTVSRLLSTGRDVEAMEVQNRGIELALFLTLPATAAFIFASEPLVRGIFQHGAFKASDVGRVAGALSAFSIGLPSYVLVKVLTPGFYARSDTTTPVRYAIISVGVNIACNLILIPTIGVLGPPLATAISSTVNVGMLYRTLAKRGHLTADAQLRRRIPRLLLAALMMGGVLYLLGPYADPYLTHGFLLRVGTLALLCSGGAIVYFLASFVTGAFALDDIRLLLRKRASTT
jgi:putative peptidoglycan lipid II flippase